MLTKWGTVNDFGGGKTNITAVGTMTSVPYKYQHKVVPLPLLEATVKLFAGPNKLSFLGA